MMRYLWTTIVILAVGLGVGYFMLSSAPQESSTTEQVLPEDTAQPEGIFCVQVFAPVCGVDRVSYSNRCVAEKQAGVEVAHEGKCEPQSGSVNIPSETDQAAVAGEEYSFSPDTVLAKKDTILYLTFQNKGSIRHNLTIDELGASTVNIRPGEGDTLKIILREAGTYTFYCSLPGHREQGMEGVLKVR